MDLTKTIEPDSSQINADDLTTGPITVTITSVSKGNAEQPVNIHLAEYPDRAYRPSKSMRRVMVQAWGPNAAEYVGRSLTLYRNPEITFGREKVGGVEISHMSHLEKDLRVALTVSRGKKRTFIVKPLATTAPTITPEQVAASSSVDDLRAMWQHASPEVQELIKARVAELSEPAQEPAP